MKKFSFCCAFLFFAFSFNAFPRNGYFSAIDEPNLVVAGEKKSINNFEKNGWSWEYSTIYFVVPAGEIPNKDNTKALMMMREPVPSGMPASKNEFAVDFENGSRSEIKINKIEKNNYIKKYHAEMYPSVDGGSAKKMDIYYCSENCAKNNGYENDIKIIGEELQITLWGKKLNSYDFFADPDLRKSGFPTIFRAFDKNNRMLWEKIYLLKTQGAIENRYGNSYAENVVVTPDVVAYMMPGDQFFYLGSRGNDSVKYSSLIQKINVSTGVPVKNNPRLVIADVHGFQNILDKVADTIQRSYVRVENEEPEQYQLSPQAGDVERQFKWSGDFQRDFMDLLNYKIQQRWFRK